MDFFIHIKCTLAYSSKYTTVVGCSCYYSYYESKPAEIDSDCKHHSFVIVKVISD